MFLEKVLNKMQRALDYFLGNKEDDSYLFDIDLWDCFKHQPIGKVASSGLCSDRTHIIAIPDNEWAPGIWAGAEGMLVYTFSPRIEVSRGIFKVKEIDLNLKVITVEEVPHQHFLLDYIVEDGDLIFMYKGENN